MHDYEVTIRFADAKAPVMVPVMAYNGLDAIRIVSGWLQAADRVSGREHNNHEVVSMSAGAVSCG